MTDVGELLPMVAEGANIRSAALMRQRLLGGLSRRVSWPLF